MALVSPTLLSRRSIAARTVMVLAMMAAFVLLTGLLDGNKGVAAAQLLAHPTFPLANAPPGLMQARDFASPSTPVIGTPFWHAVS